jgi:hypothetical protein
MKKVFLLSIIPALGALLLAFAQPRPLAKPVVFTHVTVVDATGASAKPEMTVVITGDRITELGPTETVDVPKDAEVVNARGKFLIPGLWDMHVHPFGFDKAQMQLFILNGVTGVRVMWGYPGALKWRNDIEKEVVVGPRMVISSSILDGPQPIWAGSTSLSDPAEARQAVIKAKQDSYDFVKVYSLLSREVYFAIADEAKKQELPFAGHVPISVSAGEASDAGQRSIEHLTGILAATSTKEEDLHKGFTDAYFNRPPGQTFPDLARTRPLNRIMLQTTINLVKAVDLFARLKRNQTW